MKHEVSKQKIPELHFKPEGYIRTDDAEFLNQLLGALKNNGFDPSNLVFSGFDGSRLSRGESAPQHPHIFGMNEAAWRDSVERNESNLIQFKESNPAEYAEGGSIPCLGLYDRKQLVHARSYKMPENAAPTDERLEISNIVLGEVLSDQPSEVPFEEVFVHKDYPERSPTDALVGIVFLDD